MHSYRYMYINVSQHAKQCLQFEGLARPNNSSAWFNSYTICNNTEFYQNMQKLDSEKLLVFKISQKR
jgi:hypothetical protein